MAMKMINTFIHEKTKFIDEPDLEDAIQVGKSMVKFLKKKKYISLAANQIGYDYNLCVIRDDDIKAGYDIYINSDITEETQDDGQFSLALGATSTFPANILSFKRKRILVPLIPNISVSTYSVFNNDRIEFKPTGELSTVWQICNYILNGVKKEDIVDSDYLTIRN